MAATAKTSWVVNTTRDSFQEDVVIQSHDRPIVLDFWAPWCAPCRALGPVLEKLADEYAGKFALVKANTDELPEAAAQFNVAGIPAVYAVSGGEVIDFFSGVTPEPMLRQWIDRVLAASAMADAKRLETISASAAEAKYRAIFAENSKNFDAQVGVVRMLLAQERLDDCRVAIAELEKRGYLEPEAQKVKAVLNLRSKPACDLEALRAAALAQPNDLKLQYQLAEALAGAQQYEESLDVLLSLVKRDRKSVGEQARSFMIAIFQALPDGSELTTQYRRKLSMALY